MDFVLMKNKRFKTLIKICSIINGEYEMEKDVNITLNLGQLSSFKYAPTTLYDVESGKEFQPI
jgi:hypothetical protein